MISDNILERLRTMFGRPGKVAARNASMAIHDCIQHHGLARASSMQELDLDVIMLVKF